jgi:putative hydrolase of the HAD superfamily
MSNAPTTIGFDADDTLWHNERNFKLTEARFAELLAPHADGDVLHRLIETERRNIKLYGFGIKGFTLSMIETALEVTEGRAPPAVVAEILAAGRDMLQHPVEVFEGVRETLQALTGKFRLVLITKGDLFDQERKVAGSGLDELFDAVEIVSDKTGATYTTIFDRHGDGASRALMVGNSLKSDIVPALEAGSWGVHVPHHVSWALEHAEEPVNHPRFRKLTGISGLPRLLDEIS